MPTILNPYLNFKDNAREAMEFYQGVFGGNLQIMTFKDANASQDPSDDNKLMHSQLDVPNGMTLMASDLPSWMEDVPSSNVNISLSGDNASELRGYWDGLSNGATITQPLVQAPWGATFGMLVDKFGINWMVNIAG